MKRVRTPCEDFLLLEIDAGVPARRRIKLLGLSSFEDDERRGRPRRKGHHHSRRRRRRRQQQQHRCTSMLICLLLFLLAAVTRIEALPPNPQHPPNVIAKPIRDGSAHRSPAEHHSRQQSSASLPPSDPNTAIHPEATTATKLHQSRNEKKRPRRKDNKRKKSDGTAFTRTLAHQHDEMKRHDKQKKRGAEQPKKEATSGQKKQKQKPKATASPSSSSTISRSTMLRIQREWRDAVQAGIAFDWKAGKPVALVRHEKKLLRQQQQRRRARLQKQMQSDDAETTTDNANSNYTTIEPQHVWLGPVSLHEWRVWHFSFQGVPGSVYEQGVYHGRLLLPRDYPARPPRVQVLTPSGRFTPGADLCLSASSFHPETWQPAQVHLRTLVEGVRLHMLAHAQEIGGIATATYDERLALARASREFQALWRNGALRVDHAEMLRNGWIRSSTKSDSTMGLEGEKDTPAEDSMSVGSSNGKTNENNTLSKLVDQNERETASTLIPPTLENITEKAASAAEKKTLEKGVSVVDDENDDFVAVSKAGTHVMTRSPPTARKSAPSVSKKKRKKRKRHQSPVKRQTSRNTSASSTVTTPQHTSVVLARILQKHARWLLLSFCALFIYLNKL